MITFGMVFASVLVGGIIGGGVFVARKGIVEAVMAGIIAALLIVLNGADARYDKNTDINDIALRANVETQLELFEDLREGYATTIKQLTKEIILMKSAQASELVDLEKRAEYAELAKRRALDEMKIMEASCEPL